MFSITAHVQKGYRSTRFITKNITDREALWKEDILKIIRRIQEWPVLLLNLNNNKKEQIIKDIIHIHFNNLKSLYLNHNNIATTEQLNSIQMPRLQCLVISWNRIRSVRHLRKGNWPTLRYFDFNDNSICDGATLSEGFFPQLIKISIDFVSDSTIEQIPDLRFFSKLETSNLSRIWIKKSRFKVQAIIENILKAKWTSINAHKC